MDRAGGWQHRWHRTSACPGTDERRGRQQPNGSQGNKGRAQASRPVAWRSASSSTRRQAAALAKRTIRREGQQTVELLRGKAVEARSQQHHRQEVALHPAGGIPADAGPPGEGQHHHPTIARRQRLAQLAQPACYLTCRLRGWSTTNASGPWMLPGKRRKTDWRECRRCGPAAHSGRGPERIAHHRAFRAIHGARQRARATTRDQPGSPAGGATAAAASACRGARTQRGAPAPPPSR